MTKTKDYVSAIPEVSYKKRGDKHVVDSVVPQEDSNEAKIMDEGDSDDSSSDNLTYPTLERPLVKDTPPNLMNPGGASTQVMNVVNLQSTNTQRMIVPVQHSGAIPRVSHFNQTNHIVLSGGAILTSLVMQPPVSVAPNLVTLSGPLSLSGHVTQNAVVQTANPFTSRSIILKQPTLQRFENGNTNPAGLYSGITIPDRTDIFKVPSVVGENPVSVESRKFSAHSQDPNPADRINNCILGEIKRNNCSVQKASHPNQAQNDLTKNESFINNSVSIIRVCQNMDSRKSNLPEGGSETPGTSNGSSSSINLTQHINGLQRPNASPSSSQKIIILRAPLILANGSNRFFSFALQLHQWKSNSII